MTCLDDGQIVLLIEGQLPEGARAEVEAHLDGCAACRRVVGAVAITADGGGGDGGPPALGRGASFGRYLVLSLLGAGGMGRVYAAYDPELDRRVALKVLRAVRAAEPAQRERLLREARALGRLSHPNVVQVHDVGEHGGEVFIAMELVEGRSLDAWCRASPRPGWQEVLAAYLDAARGLSAAHAKGLVHRDVKPSNILCGDDGRVRVADFGLVARSDDEDDGGSEPTGPLDERLTITGAVLGTPIYMAPEQHRGAGATAASDQYSLCVALHEGLYGELPFTSGKGATPAEIFAEKGRAPAAPPPDTPVPRWVQKAVARGLAPVPDDRHPSVDALIAALGEDPDARRRAGRRNAVIAAVVALVAIVAAGWARERSLRDPCARPERELSGVWDEGVRDRVRAAFLGTGRAYAQGTVDRVLGLLDRHGAEWATMRAEVCVASRGDEHRRELLGLRDACLDRRLGQLRALTTLFAEKPDVVVLDRAVEAAVNLSPITYCADAEALTARVRPPEEPALRAQVAALQPRVDRLEALFNAGKIKDGLALGEPLLAEAVAVPYAPLRAQVQNWMGRLQDRAGDYEAAKALLLDAAGSAAEGKDDLLVARVWARLLAVVGERQRRFDEAAVIRSLAPSVLSRVEDEAALAAWLNTESTVLCHMGHYAEARARLERVIPLREKVLGDHPDTANSINNLGNVLAALGEVTEAAALARRALTMREKTLGPGHPDVAMSLNNLGIALWILGAYPEAVDVLGRAVSIYESALGPHNPSLASSLGSLGRVYSAMGRYPEAVDAGERGLAIVEADLGPEHPEVADARAMLGRALVGLGRLDAARASLDRALAVQETYAKDPAGRRPELAEPLLGLGELSLARRLPDQALPFLERALAVENVDFAPQIQLTLADTLWQLGKDRPRARALAERAHSAYERIHHRPGLERATRWLSDHP